MNPPSLHLLCALLAGCSAPEGRDTDSSPADTGNGGETGDTGDTAPMAPSLTGLCLAPEGTTAPGSMAVDLVHFTFGAGPALGGVLAHGQVTPDLTFEIVLDAIPPAEHIGSLSAGGAWVGAIYGILVHGGQGGDGSFSEGEPLYGVSMELWLVYLEAAGAEDVPRGWSLADLGLAGQYEPNRCLLDTSEPFNWGAPEGRPSFHGLSSGVTVLLRGLNARLDMVVEVTERAEDADRIAFLPSPHFQDDPATEPALDLEVPPSGELRATLTEAPPDDTYVGADPDWRYTRHLPLLYQDLDSDGAWTGGSDSLEGSTACHQGEPVNARYTRPVHSYRGYRFLDCYGGTAGWRVTRSDADTGTRYLTSAEAEELLLDSGSCRLD